MSDFLKIFMATMGLITLSGIGYWLVRRD